MLEARLTQAETLKKVLDAVKELVSDANFDCTDEGIKLQAMDNSHVALVSLHLNASGFENYRCDRDMSLGMSLQSLQKIIKCAGNNDVVTLRADESHDLLGLLFENKAHDRVGEYEMKLMDIDQEHLGIPDTVYDAEIMLPAQEFARIIRDLKELGESVKIEVSKDGVRFSSEGDIGNAAVTLKQTNGDRAASDSESDEEPDEEEDEDKEEQEDVKDEDDDVIVEDEKPEAPDATAKSDSGSPAPKPTAAEDADADEKPEIAIDSDDEEEAGTKKKVKSKGKAKATVKKEKKDSKKRKAPAKKAPKEKKAKKDDTPRKVAINLQQAVALTFSIKYLSNFAKSTPLSEYVHLHMSNEVPLLVEYPFEAGHLRYYLAPKIAEE